MKVGSIVIGFILVCVGIAALAGQTPVLGVHPAVWFILGIGLMLSDSAWARLARKKREDGEEGAGEADGTSERDTERDSEGSDEASTR